MTDIMSEIVVPAIIYAISFGICCGVVWYFIYYLFLPNKMSKSMLRKAAVVFAGGVILMEIVHRIVSYYYGRFVAVILMLCLSLLILCIVSWKRKS